MPPKNISNIKEMYIKNLETGEQIKFDGVSDISFDEEIVEYDYKPIELSKEFSFTLDITEMSIVDKLRLLGITNWKIIQNKKHKNKRINKKWAKRYGYSCIIW